MYKRQGSYTVRDLNAVGVVTASAFSGPLTGNATGLTGTPDITVGAITAASADFSGNVSVGGTLTYEDVTNIDSVGVITARSGVNVTGGSVGIGTDNPTSALEIRTTTTNSATHYRNNASNSGAYFGVRATDLGAASAGEAYIYSYNSGINLLADGTGDINFATGGTGSKVRITSSGSVGIGSVIPAQTLDIMSANPVIRLTDTDPSGVYSQIDGAGGDLILAADGGAGSSNSFISLRVDGTDANAEKLRITSAGDMGLGTATPTSFGPTFQVAGTDPALLLQDTATAVDYFGMNIA